MLAEPIDIKEERIAGQIVMMAPAGTGHNTIAHNLHLVIGNYLYGKRCRMFGETYVFLDEENHFIPDLMVVCEPSQIKPNHIEGAPDLVIEILSASTKKRDIGVKKKAYERFGVKEYWIINPVDRSVEVYHLRNGVFDLDDVYYDYTQEDWEGLTARERQEAKLSLKVSLYDDLEIPIKRIFADV